MRIIELLRLNTWCQDVIVSGGIIEKYNSLQRAVASNVTSSAKTPFSNEKEHLISAINSVSCNDLTLEQIELLEELKLFPLLGADGANEIEGIFNDNQMDIASVSNMLKEHCTTIESATAYLTDIASQLGKHFSEDESDSIAENETLIRIYFKEQAGINNLSDLKEQGYAWYQIGRGIAMSIGATPEDIRVIGAESGSVIIDIIAISAIAHLVSKIVLDVLNVAQKILDIRKLMLETEKLRLENDKIRKEFQNEIDKEKAGGVDKILDSICADKKMQNLNGEQRDALKKSIELLLNFTEGGGKLDFIHNYIDEDDGGEADAETLEASLSASIQDVRNEVLQIDKNATEIRAIEQKIKAITMSLEEHQ